MATPHYLQGTSIFSNKGQDVGKNPDKFSSTNQKNIRDKTGEKRSELNERPVAGRSFLFLLPALEIEMQSNGKNCRPDWLNEDVHGWISRQLILIKVTPRSRRPNDHVGRSLQRRLCTGDREWIRIYVYIPRACYRFQHVRRV